MTLGYPGTTSNLNALRLQADRKSAGNVGKFTGLDQGIYF